MYDQAKADRAVEFVRLLRHTKGRWAGVPFNLASWQEDIIRKLFGTVNEDGFRQYRKAFITLARKNGKSEIGSAIGLYMLFADGERGAEIYSAAADKEQAGIVFYTAAQMVRQSPGLSGRCKIIDSQKRIVVPSTGSFWRVLSSEAYTKHGLNPHAVIFDELHAQPNRDLRDTLATGFGAREQPLTVYLTTAGYDRHSIYFEEYSYAQRVLAGEIDDPTYLPVIYELSKDADWQDERLWGQANPALGDFLYLSELRAMAAEAAQKPAMQNVFRRLRLNQQTEQADRWLDMDAWDASAGVVDLDELEGQECYGGLDLSSTKDVTALVLGFPVRSEERGARSEGEEGTHETCGEGGTGAGRPGPSGSVVKLVCHFWIPEEQMAERIKRDRVPYDVWVREGLVTATPGNAIDYAAIREYILAARERWAIREIAYDPWNASQLVMELTEDGITMVPIRQGIASMASPTKQFEVRILNRTLHHGGNPVLRWMAGNVQVMQDAHGNYKPDKGKSSEKIDGIVAAVMMVDRIVRHEDETSVYEERGLVVI